MGANLLSSILCAPAFKMGILSRHLRVPRPRTFLYLMSLRTGVEMVSLSVIFNKLTGFFGLLAILTGVSLSPLQLSMYIYSVGALALISFLMPHIRRFKTSKVSTGPPGTLERERRARSGTGPPIPKLN